MNRLVMTLMVPMVVACSSSGDDERQRVPDAAVPQCEDTSDTCPGDTICFLGRCEPAFPRLYRITNLVHTVGTTNASGADWDVGGGAPDLFIVISSGGTVAATTPVVDDQFSVTYAGPFLVTLTAGSALTLQSFDEDISSNDLAYKCEAAPITSQLLRGRGLMCGTGTPSMSFRILPQ